MAFQRSSLNGAYGCAAAGEAGDEVLADKFSLPGRNQIRDRLEVRIGLGEFFQGEVMLGNPGKKPGLGHGVKFADGRMGAEE